MKKIIVWAIIIFIFIIGISGCQTPNKLEKTNINDSESSEEKALETIKSMVDEPVRDTFELYFVTSGIDNSDDFTKNVENRENFEKNKKEINEIISKLSDKKGGYVFSEESETIISQNIYSAKQVIKYKNLEIENRYSGNEEKQDEMQEAYFNEITKIGELIVKYEKLYVDFHRNK